MFAQANALARNFTLSVIISFQKSTGTCGSGIGTCVVLNDEGWFITAFHIMEEFRKLSQSCEQVKPLIIKRKEVESNKLLKEHEKKKQLNALKISSDAVINASISIGPGWNVEPNFKAIPVIDLAVGKIANFNKDSIKIYPTFKNPSHPMEPGASLCKLGYPFHEIIPIFDEAQGAFMLPEGSFPVPIFPIDGILARIVALQPPNPMPYPLMYIETTSPGLRGQSGGPTFDVQGNIWAIQSQTRHYKLGFGGTGASGTAKEREHLSNQYFNTGWGIHSKTIVGFLNENNIKHNLSSN